MENLRPLVETAWDKTIPLPDFASILIVDDQRFDRERLRRYCDQLDFTTYLAEAGDLQSMGTALDKDAFDLVILDYNLPDGTGLDAISAIRRHSKHRRSAIIMVTGENQSEIAIEAMKRGCSDYIDKNALSPEGLRRATVNALQKSALTAGIENQEIIRRRVEKVLQHFTRECVLEIKPMLSRMMRQIRTLGRDGGTEASQTQLELDRSCTRLWEFLSELEAVDGQDFVNREFPGKNPLESNNTQSPASDHNTATVPKRPGVAPRRPARPSNRGDRLVSRPR